MKREAPLHKLSDYLPEGTLDSVLEFLHQYKIHLTVTRGRQSLLGDYRQPDYRNGHRITVNGNMNCYEFLLTLLHELAHLLTFIQFGSQVPSHGKEWKEVFRSILSKFLGKGYFPGEVERAVLQSLGNPGASKCSEVGLARVLKNYNPSHESHHFVEELKEGEIFETPDGRIFERGPKIRKRFKCSEVKTRKVYLFSPIFEVRRFGF